MFALAALRRSSRELLHASQQRGIVSAASLQFFKASLGDAAVVTDAHALKPYNDDWMNKFHGRSEVMLRPRTTQEVSTILRHCSEHQIAIVPQGGNTGLAGGGVPIQDEVILNLGRMNTIIDMQQGGALVCEAGCILEELDRRAGESGFTMPLDLGAKGSCQIGGNVSTNAAGLRFLRYGSLRGSVLGLEVVLADGTVLDSLKTLRKDNTGYDLKQLFIGAEGTLGVITKVAIQCTPRSRAVNTILLAVPNFSHVPHLHALARAHLAEILSAFEFLDAASLHLALTHLPGVHSPVQGLHAMYMLIETSGSRADHDTEKLEQFVEACLEAGHAEDAVLAGDSAQTANVWSIREGISESLQKHGTTYKYDLSMPMERMYDLVEAVRERVQPLGPSVVVAGYGHVGDGNLHLNISDGDRRPASEVMPLLEPFIYEWTMDQRGSISAEHGLGQMKNEAVHYSQSQHAIVTMRRLKALFDPKNILNPGKLLPSS